MQAQPWAATVIFIADLHGWLYVPGTGGRSLQDLASFLKNRIYNRSRTLDPVFEGRHGTILVIGGDAVAYDSPLCGDAAGILLALESLDALASSVGAVPALLLGNHELEMLRDGVLLGGGHTHPAWLFDSQLECTYASEAFKANMANVKVGPLWLLGMGGGHYQEMICGHDGTHSVRLGSGTQRMPGPYLLLLHRQPAGASELGRLRDYISTVHDQERLVGQEDHCGTLVAHFHGHLYDTSSAPPGVWEVPAYAMGAVELRIDARDGQRVTVDVSELPVPRGEMPGFAAWDRLLAYLTSPGGLLERVAYCDAPVVHWPSEPMRPGALLWHVAKSQMRAALAAVPECQQLQLSSKSVLIGGPQKHESGLPEGDVTRMDALAIMPHGTRLEVMAVGATAWMDYLNAPSSPPRGRGVGNVLFPETPPTPNPDGQVVVATTSWTAARDNFPSHTVLGTAGLTSHIWLDYVSDKFPVPTTQATTANSPPLGLSTPVSEPAD